MSALRFGTDGVRGVANSRITPEYAVALGRAAAIVAGSGCVLIGSDTRRSSPMLASAVAAGVASAGADALDMGVLSTPALASYSASLGLAAVMVSASHNPASDNGLKVFAPGGNKLTSTAQGQIEELIGGFGDPDSGASLERPTGAGVGRVGTIGTSLFSQIAYAYADVATLSEQLPSYSDAIVQAGGGPGSLSGLAVCFDGANGAASYLGPQILRELGADVIALACDPDGMNINDGCGSTHPESLVDAVRSRPGSVGVAVDGDADRCMLVDETGALVDGDQILAICALDMAKRGALANNGIAITVMSNLGLRRSLDEANIRYVETPVGDRFVAEAMAEHGFELGGEQSGHVIFGDVATTGDGVLSAVRALSVCVREGVALSDACAQAMTRLPQVIVNVRTDGQSSGGLQSKSFEVAKARADAELGANGRVLVRESGTEPLVRVMVEAPDADDAQRIADQLAAALR